MKRIFVSIIGLLSFVLFTAAILSAADYGDTDVKEYDYIYYIAEIGTDDSTCRVFAESWSVDGDWIVFERIFKKKNCGDNTTPAIKILANPEMVHSITAITDESKEKVVNDNSNDCFIGVISW